MQHIRCGRVFISSGAARRGLTVRVRRVDVSVAVWALSGRHVVCPVPRATCRVYCLPVVMRARYVLSVLLSVLRVAVRAARRP